MTHKPCYFCGILAPVTFDHAALFNSWVDANSIIAPFRSRFNGMRERLKWAAKDETDTGAHPLCALQWAIKEEGYAERYEATEVMIDFDEVRRLVADGYISERRHPSADLRILNYTPKTQYAGLWTPETRRCRGLIVDDSNKIIARPFEKFFNYDEIGGRVPLEPFEVFEKVDGSLGIMYWIGDRPFIATRGSFESEQAAKANEILRTKYDGAKFDPALTYLFEIVFPANRIVVDYGGTEDIFFLAAVETATGREVDAELPEGMPRARRYDGIDDVAELSRYENETDEGFVVRFESGTRVKFKFSEYKRLHRLLTQVSSKSIWESLRDGNPLDEILERVPDEFCKWVRDTKINLESRFAAIEGEATEIFRRRPETDSRKAQALYFNDSGFAHLAVLFNMLDGKDYGQVIWRALKPKFERPFRNDEG